MVREHVAHLDSHQLFTSGNYEVETSSAIEWRFVAENETPPVGGWPVEQKILEAEAARAAASGEVRARGATLLESGVRPRVPMPLATLQQLTAERSAQLRSVNEPDLLEQEAIGARLYTGPLFVKYNAVLRGLGSDVPFLPLSLARLCCDRATAARLESGALSFDALRNGRQINLYTTTLHTINSSIVKLSKLTYVTAVYRGVSGRVLPEEFWRVNAFGVKGGIESAFMSTTTNYDVAKAYAAGGASTILEIQQGMVDRGADISFLSQYPHEKEILFAPLTGLEVRGVRIDGTALVVEVALSINLSSLTIEEVIGKRKKVLQDMMPGLEADMRHALALEGLATPEGTEFLVGRLRELCMGKVLRKDAAFYNVDSNLQRKLGELLETFASMKQGVMRSSELAMAGAALTRYGFDPAAFSSDVMAHVKRAERGETEQERAYALEVMGNLRPELLAPHVGIVGSRLANDESAFVRNMALRVLHKVEPRLVEPYTRTLVGCLSDGSDEQRSLAVGLLAKLRSLVEHTEPLIMLLRTDQSLGARVSAMNVLCKLDAEVLAQHVDVIAAKLKDDSEEISVHRVAVKALQKVAAASLLKGESVCSRLTSRAPSRALIPV